MRSGARLYEREQCCIPNLLRSVQKWYKTRGHSFESLPVIPVSIAYAMNLPGWNSLDSVKSIDSHIQIATLLFWALLVVCEIIGVAWKKRAKLFNILALCAFAIAVFGESIHYKYDDRKEALHDAREADLSATYEKEISDIKANTTPIPDRHLTADQAKVLTKVAAEFPRQPVRILYAIGNGESRTYAEEFAALLAAQYWQVQGMMPAEFNFKGLGIAAQDTTEVPEAAEAIAEALESKGTKVQRFHDISSVSIDGKHANSIFGLFVSENGDQSSLPRKFIPIHKPRISNNPAKVDAMSDEMLEQEAHQLANAMREFESVNKGHFEQEWRVTNRPIPKGSYRDVFEKDYKPTAIQLRAEFHKRLGLQDATVFALDADTLAGPSPLTDAANYLDELAKQLAAKQP